MGGVADRRLKRLCNSRGNHRAVEQPPGYTQRDIRSDLRPDSAESSGKCGETIALACLLYGSTFTQRAWRGSRNFRSTRSSTRIPTKEEMASEYFEIDFAKPYNIHGCA